MNWNTPEQIPEPNRSMVGKVDCGGTVEADYIVYYNNGQWYGFPQVCKLARWMYIPD